MAKLFVGNIPHSSSNLDLQEWMESHGFAVTSAEVIRDRATGGSRGFGFVELRDDWRAQDAITALNGLRMGTRPLTINHASPVGPRQGVNRETGRGNIQ